MKRVYIALFVLCVVAAALSVMMISGQDELSFVMLNDQRFSDAQAILEKRLQSGERSPYVLKELAKLKMRKGDAGGALLLYEELSRDRAGDDGLRSDIGALRHIQMQSAEWLSYLENSGSREDVRQLVFEYRKRALFDKETGVLEKLVNSGDASTNDFAELARLQASRKTYEKASQTLSKLYEKFPQDFDPDLLFLAARVSINGDKLTSKSLISLIERVLESKSEISKAISLAWFYLEEGRADLGLRLLEPYASMKSEDLLNCVIALRLELGQKERVYGELKKLRHEKALPDRLVPELLELARERNDNGEIESIYRDRLEMKSLPDSEKREIAYAFADNLNRKDLAIGILRGLAAEESPEDKDVKQLLFLWGTTPPKEAVSWISDRYRSAGNNRDRVAWLNYLMATGQASQVVVLIEEDHQDPSVLLLAPELNAVYLQGLLVSQNVPRLSKALDALVQKETDPQRLIRGLSYAEQLSLSDKSEALLRKLTGITPADPFLHEKLGILLFEKRDFVGAKAELDRYYSVAPKGEDKEKYLAAFYYGELLKREAREKEAKAYYTEVLRILGSLAEKNDRQSLIEARAYERLGNKSKAISLLKEVIKGDARKKAEVALLVNLLVDEKRFEEERELLDPELEGSK